MNELYNITSLAEKYISDIPWGPEANYFLYDYDSLENNFKEKIGESLEKTKIKFNDDTWDFNMFYLNSNNKSYRITFSNIKDEKTKKYLKFYLLYLISLSNKKIPTIVGDVDILKTFFKKLNKPIIQISTNDIKDYVNNSTFSTFTKNRALRTSVSFFDFLEKAFQISLNINCNNLLAMVKRKNKTVKTDEDKTANIPDKLFDCIHTVAINVLNDEHESINKRMSAGALIILMQTGLRIGDVMILRTDSLKEYSSPADNKEYHYLRVYTQKNGKFFEITSTDVCTNAFNKMLQLRKGLKFESSEYLYILEAPPKQPPVKIPVATKRFNKEYRRILCENMHDVVVEDWDGVKKIKVPVELKKVYNQDNKRIFDYTYEYLSIPDTRQYRVHLATELYNKGYSYAFIKRHLCHLSNSMEGYYCRPGVPESPKFTEKIIRELVQDKIKPIGKHGTEMSETINDFIKKNNFRIETDIDAIIKAFGPNLAIRAKTGGCCLKTSFVPCAYDKTGDNLLCAYNLCPNIYHFFYNIDVSWTDYKTAKAAYESNKASGRIAAANKEHKKMELIARNRLNEEVIELEKEIVKRGTVAILQQYPTLKEVIDNLETIKEEISKCITH